MRRIARFVGMVSIGERLGQVQDRRVSRHGEVWPDHREPRRLSGDDPGGEHAQPGSVDDPRFTCWGSAWGFM